MRLAVFGWLGAPVDSPGFFDIGSNQKFMAGVRMIDVGDVDVHLDPDRTRERITTHARSLVDRGMMLVSIGGDHSVTYPLAGNSFVVSMPKELAL
jgi:arginase family enzyme